MISTATRARIDLEIAKYPAPRGAMLPALHLVQAERGYVAQDAAVELADILGVRPIEVLEVVSFYNLYYAEPQARHHVFVCTNLPCSLRGARGLLRGLEARLGVDADGNTADGRIHLGHEECLGACAYAPMLRVDGTYHEALDLEGAVAILEALT